MAAIEDKKKKEPKSSLQNVQTLFKYEPDFSHQLKELNSELRA